jgi:hypothetical protein
LASEADCVLEPLDDLGEVHLVDVAAERQALRGPNGDVEKPIEEAVGGLGHIDVAQEFIAGDVANRGDVSGGRARRRGL